MNKVLFIAALFLCFTGNAQKAKKAPPKKKATKSVKAKTSLNITTLTSKTIPKNIHYEGQVKNAVRWTDKQGDNIVILTESGIYESKKSLTGDGRSADLFAYHYIVKSGKSVSGWKINDRIRDCAFDIKLHFIKNAFHITDLDNDGIAETWTMYKTSCHSDVSPSEMKIIMYEGKQKYAIRGTNRVKLSEHEIYGGEYKPDEAFNKAPKQFRDHARELWQKNELDVRYSE